MVPIDCSGLPRSAGFNSLSNLLQNDTSDTVVAICAISKQIGMGWEYWMVSRQWRCVL